VLKAPGKAEVTGKYTVRWPRPPDLSVLAAASHRWFLRSARHTMTREQFEARPIGTGPYRATAWPVDGTVQLEAWDGYRGGKPFPEKLTFRPRPRALDARARARRGTAQVATAIPIESLPLVGGNPKLEAVSLTGGSAPSYVINLFKTTPPLRDRRVRQAMNYAADRAAIVVVDPRRTGAVMAAPLWPGWLGSSDELVPIRTIPSGRALLKEAGYPNGFGFRWTCDPGRLRQGRRGRAGRGQPARPGRHQGDGAAGGARADPGRAQRGRVRRHRADLDDVLASRDPAALTLNASFPDGKLTPKWGRAPAGSSSRPAAS
jgi:ABC-type transport system substrate-binding protein